MTMDDVFVVYPEATINTADGSLCARYWPSRPAPSVGDRMLVFNYGAAEGIGGHVLHVDASTGIILEHGDEVPLPRNLTADHDVRTLYSFDAINELVRKASRGSGGS